MGFEKVKIVVCVVELSVSVYIIPKQIKDNQFF